MNHFYIVSHNKQNSWGSDLIAVIAPDGVTERQIMDELEFIADEKKEELELAEELPYSDDLECEIFDGLVNRFPGLSYHYVRASHFDYDIDCI
jgi:hypothetical protein